MSVNLKGYGNWSLCKTRHCSGNVFSGCVLSSSSSFVVGAVIALIVVVVFIVVLFGGYLKRQTGTHKTFV